MRERIRRENANQDSERDRNREGAEKCERIEAMEAKNPRKKAPRLGRENLGEII